MSDIFVSYSHKDRSRLERVVGALEGAGFSVFWSKRLRGGWLWRRVLDREIRSARCMIVVWSTDAVTSDWVADEADLGLKLKILVPARIDAVEPPLGFNGVQVVDLMGWTGDVQDARWLELLEAVGEKLAATAAAPSTAAPSGGQAGAQRADAGPARLGTTAPDVSSMSPRRRRFLIGGAAVLAALPAAGLIRAVWPPERNPRFRTKIDSRASTAATTPLRLGFYRYPSSEVIYYVSRAWYPLQQHFVPPRANPESTPRKRRRIGHEEPRLHFPPVARIVTPPNRNSEQLVIRDGAGIDTTLLERIDEDRLPEPAASTSTLALYELAEEQNTAAIDAANTTSKVTPKKVPHVVFRRASFSFEQAAILHLRAAAESPAAARGERAAAALELLLNGIAHDLTWKKKVKGRPSYRLLDLAAAVAVHYNQESRIATLVGMLETKDDPRLADRIAKWNDENSEWRSRVTNGPIFWAGLPT